MADITEIVVEKAINDEYVMLITYPCSTSVRKCNQLHTHISLLQRSKLGGQQLRSFFVIGGPPSQGDTGFGFLEVSIYCS